VHKKQYEFFKKAIPFAQLTKTNFKVKCRNKESKGEKGRKNESISEIFRGE